MPLITPEHLDRVDDHVGTAIVDRTEIGLADAHRHVSRLLLGDPRSPREVKPMTVSALLRKRGWAKVGITGTGYDRQPLYRKVA